MALSVANVVLTDTFDTWRIRTNQIIAQAFDATSPTLGGASVSLITFASNTVFQGTTNTVEQNFTVQGDLNLSGLDTTASDVAGAVNEVNGNVLAFAIALG